VEPQSGILISSNLDQRVVYRIRGDRAEFAGGVVVPVVPFPSLDDGGYGNT
jgi:hypothetical protein